MKRCTCLRTVLALALLPVVSTTWAQSEMKKPDVTKDPTLYVVGYAHLDTQWRWCFPDTIGTMIPNTLHDNFRLFDAYPDYVFNFSGSNRYRMMQEYYPADFERLRKYVANGRWFPCGSSVDECDGNATGAESIIRHVLYGNHYFEETFQKSSAEFMLPDCFGFPASLPSLLGHCGMKGFSTQKLTWGSAVGVPFPVGVWEGLNGTGVIAALDPGSYGGGISVDLSKDEKWMRRVKETGDKSGAFVGYHYYGTGDVGGAPREDAVKWLEASVKSDGPLNIISSTAEQMFVDIPTDKIEKLPRYKGDLLLTEHSAGSITSEAYMKRLNRQSEILADSAERAALLAAWLGGPSYPQARLNRAWSLLLGSQMHDILPGTSLPRAYEFSWNDDFLALNQFTSVLDTAVSAVAAGLDTQVKGVAVVVYNPLAIERQDVVEASLTGLGKAAAVRVFGPDGKETPAQILGSEGDTTKVAFVASVPSVGVAVFDVRPADAPAASDDLKVTEASVENARYRVTLDANGDVASIFDKAANREMFASPARLAFQHENPAAWPAWNMDWNDRQKPPRGYVTGPAKVRIAEQGPARVALEVTRESEGSRFVQTIRLGAGDAGNRVEFANRFDWQSRECCLKATFPLTVSNPQATYNWEVGTILRGNNDPRKYEVPSHQWFDLTDKKGDYGVTVLTDCKYGSDKPDDNTVRLTLVYSPGVRGGYPDQATQDWGRHEFVYGVAGHKGDWREGQTDWQGMRLNQPMVTFQSASHAGKLGNQLSLLNVSSNRVRVMALKQAERNADEIIVRLVELDGQPANSVHVKLAGPIVAAHEVNGQEKRIADAKVENGELVTDLVGYGLRTFAIKLGAAPVQLQSPTGQPVALKYDRCVTSHDGEAVVGGFDGKGSGIPAEMLPTELSYRGLTFKLGPIAPGQPNAVVCNGQTIDLPAGKGDRVYLLAAAAGGDQPVSVAVDGKATALTIQNWTGLIGSWDDRVWKQAKNPEDGDWPYEYAGVRRAYLKRDPVAWFCSHHHGPDGSNQIYQYCYLFAYAIDLPAGAKQLTLPKNEQVLVLAATVAADDPAVAVRLAQPLSDPLVRNDVLSPRIVPDGGKFDNVTYATLERPLFSADDALHYTVDGSEPTPQSPEYEGAFLLTSDTTIKARLFDAKGNGGAIAETKVQVADTTPPKVENLAAFTWSPEVRLAFSEPLDPKAAQDVQHYAVSGGTVKSATLSDDGKRVKLTLAAPPTENKVTVTLNGVRDRSPSGNPLKDVRCDVTCALPLAQLRETTLDGKGGGFEQLELGSDAPVKAKSPWTINMWLWCDENPPAFCLFAGIGTGDGGRGTQRYLTKFPHGLHFWGSNVDIPAGAPVDVKRWQMLTATYDGEIVRVFKDGEELVAREASLADAEPVATAGQVAPWPQKNRLTGKLAGFTVWNQALPADAVAVLYEMGHEAELPTATKP